MKLLQLTLPMLFLAIVAQQAAAEPFTFDSASVPTTPPVTSGLVLRLTADEGITESSGRVTAWADQSGNGNNANSTGSTGPLLIPNGSPNGLSPVLRFDPGGNRYLTVPNSAELNPGTGGLTVFIAGQQTDFSSSHVWYSKGNNSSGNDGYLVYRSSSGPLFHRVGVGTAAESDRAVQTLNPPPTDFVVLTSRMDGSEILAYVNGDDSPYTAGDGSIMDAAYTGDVSNTDPFRIGARPGGDLDFYGDIGEILIYDRALSESEIAAVNEFLLYRFVLDPPPLTPEPASLALMGVALVGLAGWKWRRRG